MNEPSFDDVSIKVGEVTMTFTYIGEGLSGDYGETQSDVPLLRVDAYHHNDEHLTPSWCSNISIADFKADPGKWLNFLYELAKHFNTIDRDPKTWENELEKELR